MTNKCPVGPNRGFSRMQNVWFLERVVDICARKLGIPADEMRQRNYITEMPYTTPNGCVYDSGDYGHMLDTAKELIGWDEWQKKIADDARAKAAWSASASAPRSIPAPTISASPASSIRNRRSREIRRPPMCGSAPTAR